MSSSEYSHIFTGHADSIPSDDSKLFDKARSYRYSAWVIVKVALGFSITAFILNGLGSPSVSVYSALSAAVAVLYLAGLTDVKRLRDGLVLLVPTLFVWLLLAVDHRNAMLVGLGLFAHIATAFFVGVTRSSGGLQSFHLWPVLFGISSSSMWAFANQFLI